MILEENKGLLHQLRTEGSIFETVIFIHSLLAPISHITSLFLCLSTVPECEYIYSGNMKMNNTF